MHELVVEQFRELIEHNRDCHKRVGGVPVPGIARGTLDAPLRERLAARDNG